MLNRYVAENRYYSFALDVPVELAQPPNLRINIEENRFGLDSVLPLTVVTLEP